MKLKYGTYLHAIDEASIQISKTALLNDDGVPYAIRERWNVDGILQGVDQTAITTAIQQLEQAYNRNDKDMELLFDSGTATAHRLLARNTVDGVHVTAHPAYPIGDGAEYSTFRTYSISVEADVLTKQPGSDLLTFEQTITFGGGGPRKVIIELRTGPPQVQQVSEQTPWQARQFGRAVGLSSYPVRPAPIWPQWYDRWASDKLQVSPRRSGAGRDAEFEVGWNYLFSAPVILDRTF